MSTQENSREFPPCAGAGDSPSPDELGQWLASLEASAAPPLDFWRGLEPNLDLERDFRGALPAAGRQQAVRPASGASFDGSPGSSPVAGGLPGASGSSATGGSPAAGRCAPGPTFSPLETIDPVAERTILLARVGSSQGRETAPAPSTVREKVLPAETAATVAGSAGSLLVAASDRLSAASSRPIPGSDPGGSGSSRSSDSTPAASRRGRRLSTAKITGLLLVAFIFFALLGFYGGDLFMGGVKSGPINGEPGSKVPGGMASAGETPSAFNILILGTDQRDREPSRADAILVAFLDTASGQVRLLSLPRDLYVDIPGYGKQKLAHAHAYGGPDLTLRTVQQFLGVPLQRYVEVNFSGFEKIIDLLDGVDYNVEKRMIYPPEGIDLYPGPQRLSGPDALAYVRYRSDAMGDISRIERQQKFLNAVFDQALRLSTVPKLPALVRELAANVHTSLSVTQMLSLARALKNAGSSGIEAAMVPGEPQYIDEVSYWIPDRQKLVEILDKYSARKSD